MDFTAALPTFFITLREGVEAALVVGIVLACLNKSNRQGLNGWVLFGVVAGLAGSVMMGITLGAGLQQLQLVLPNVETVVKPLLNVLFCFIAIIMLSWMLLWMTRQSRSLKAEIEDNIQSALEDNLTAGWSIFSLICIAVLREGLKRFCLFLPMLIPARVGFGSSTGSVGGGALIGVALFRWGIRINLKRFFQVMGSATADCGRAGDFGL
jgi:high-affinity iron transporter